MVRIAAPITVLAEETDAAGFAEEGRQFVSNLAERAGKFAQDTSSNQVSGVLNAANVETAVQASGSLLLLPFEIAGGLGEAPEKLGDAASSKLASERARLRGDQGRAAELELQSVGEALEAAKPFLEAALVVLPGAAALAKGGPKGGPLKPVEVPTQGVARTRAGATSEAAPLGEAEGVAAAKGGVPEGLATKVSQKQLRHVKGRDEWKARGEGSYFNSADDAQAVLDAVHGGNARVLGTTSQGHVVVEVKGVTGFNNNSRAGFVDQPTNVFMVKGTASPSVVPTSPAWKPRKAP